MASNKARMLLSGLLISGLAALLLTPKTSAQVYTEGADVWNHAESTGADVLTSSLTTTSRGGANIQATTYQVSVEIKTGAADSVLYLRINQSDGFSENVALNGNVALVNGQGYSFQFVASNTFSYNFRVGTNTTIGMLVIDRKVN